VASMLQAGGVVKWLSDDLFYVLNLPAFALARVLMSGERSILLLPLMIPAQWLAVGIVLGLVLHYAQSGRQ
jgi:hypothetical protein